MSDGPTPAEIDAAAELAAGESVSRETPPAPPAAGRLTAAAKLARTLRELSMPNPDATEMELALASVAMGLEQQLGPMLDTYQQDGSLDEFVTALARWIALHRSDALDSLVVVELPSRELPAGTRLHRLDQAIEAMAEAESPL